MPADPGRHRRAAPAAEHADPAAAASPLPEAQRLDLLYFMRLNRAFDERVSTLYRQNRIPGAAFSSLGQEAISVGSAYALEPGDVIGPVIRNSGAILVRGVEPGRYLANFLGRATSPTRGRDGNNHLGDLARGILAPVSMLGVLIPVCAGAGLAFKYRGERRIALTWIGDGGSSIGDFHEGLNFAAVLKLPLVLILENNGYAYSTPIDRQCLVRDFVDKAEGYGVPGAVVDGNDVEAVYRVTRSAAERARRGEGPTFIEAKTMRMRGHAEHDDFRYVPRALLEEWRRKDPIDRFARRLRDDGVLSAERERDLDRRVAEEMEAAVRFAEESPLPEAGEAATGVYAES